MFKNSDKEKIVGTFMGNGYSVKLEENTVIFIKKGQQPFLLDLNTQSDFSEMLIVANLLKVTEVSRDKEIGQKILSDSNHSTSDVVDIIYDSMVEKLDSKKIEDLKQTTSELEDLLKSENLSQDSVEIFGNVITQNFELVEKFSEGESVEEESESTIIAVAEVQDGMSC